MKLPLPSPDPSDITFAVLGGVGEAAGFFVITGSEGFWADCVAVGLFAVEVFCWFALDKFLPILKLFQEVEKGFT